MSSVPCSSSIRFLYWSFSFIDVDTLLPLEVDRLLCFVERSDQPCPLSRFESTSVLRTKIGDSALALNRRCTRLSWITTDNSAPETGPPYNDKSRSHSSGRADDGVSDTPNRPRSPLLLRFHPT